MIFASGSEIGIAFHTASDIPENQDGSWGSASSSNQRDLRLVRSAGSGGESSEAGCHAGRSPQAGWCPAGIPHPNPGELAAPVYVRVRSSRYRVQVQGIAFNAAPHIAHLVIRFLLE